MEIEYRNIRDCSIRYDTHTAYREGSFGQRLIVQIQYSFPQFARYFEVITILMRSCFSK